MSYSKDGKDWLGRERMEHYDDKGNKVGTSKDSKDWLGNERVEHYDDKGNKVGTSKDGKDWLGNERAEHFDDSGKKTGTSKSEKDIFGNNITQHYDNQGNKTKFTKVEKNWLGQTIFKHRIGGGSGDGLYGIIAIIVIIALIVVAILGTFSYPYKLIDSSISPFHLDWTSNEYVWIFCTSIWLLIITSIIFVKKILANTSPKYNLDELFINPIYIVILITSSLSIVVQYLVKSKISDGFLLVSIILTIIIIGGAYLIYQNSKFKVQIIITTILLSSISLIYINTKSNITGEVVNIPNSSVNIVEPTNKEIQSNGNLNEPIFKTNEENSSNNEINTIGYYYVKATNDNLIYFYRTPNVNDRKNAYFNANDQVSVTSIENDFGYVEFTNSRGQTSKGWIRLIDLSKEANVLNNEKENDQASNVFNEINIIGQYYVKATNDNLVYFYRTPNVNDRKNAYFNSNDLVNVTSIENGFGYVEFTNSRGQTSKGWIRLIDLSIN